MSLAAGQATLAAQLLARIRDLGHQEEFIAEASEALGRGQDAAVRPAAA